MASTDDMIHQIALRVDFLQGVVSVTHDVELEAEVCSVIQRTTLVQLSGPNLLWWPAGSNFNDVLPDATTMPQMRRGATSEF